VNFLTATLKAISLYVKDENVNYKIFYVYKDDFRQFFMVKHSNDNLMMNDSTFADGHVKWKTVTSFRRFSISNCPSYIDPTLIDVKHSSDSKASFLQLAK
jgi:hypothetical protein